MKATMTFETRAQDKIHFGDIVSVLLKEKWFFNSFGLLTLLTVNTHYYSLVLCGTCGDILNPDLGVNHSAVRLLLLLTKVNFFSSLLLSGTPF